MKKSSMMSIATRLLPLFQTFCDQNSIFPFGGWAMIPDADLRPLLIIRRATVKWQTVKICFFEGKQEKKTKKS